MKTAIIIVLGFMLIGAYVPKEKYVVSGSFTYSASNEDKFTVTFPTPQENDTYVVCVTATNSISAPDFYVTNKTTEQFEVWYTGGNLTGDVDLDWILIPDE